MKSTLFAVAMVLSLAVSSASAAAPQELGQPIVRDPVSQNCECIVYWMGEYWCVPCD